MTRQFAILLSILLGLLGGAAQAAGTPAGYVVAIALAGEDASARTAVVRQGKELPPKLMMPLYDGDVVFLRDAASRIGVELGNGKTMEVGGDVARYDVKGKIDTGDDAWSILTAIGNVLSGDQDEIPQNMVARGDPASIDVAMAVHGANYIVRGNRLLWLSWSGGTGPYALTVSADGVDLKLPPAAGPQAEVPLSAVKGDLVIVTIRDAAAGAAIVRLRLRDAAPALPDKVKNAAPGQSAGTLVAAAWLVARDKGAWTIEAAQALHARGGADQAATALLAQLARGWKP